MHMHACKCSHVMLCTSCCDCEIDCSDVSVLSDHTSAVVEGDEPVWFKELAQFYLVFYLSHTQLYMLYCVLRFTDRVLWLSRKQEREKDRQKDRQFTLLHSFSSVPLVSSGMFTGWTLTSHPHRGFLGNGLVIPIARWCNGRFLVILVCFEVFWDKTF